MGLDSVELPMEWERYFNIEIPDIIAEKITTVQNAVDAISAILNISDEGTEPNYSVFNRLQNAIAKSGLANAPIAQSDLVAKVHPDCSKHEWTLIARELELEVPFPPCVANDNSFKSIILAAIRWTPNFNYAEFTFSEFTDIICGNNYQTLIDARSIKTRYEIYIVLMAMIVEKIGISIYEFKSGKIFIGDFGID
jgi:hypothetical protein